MELLKSPGGCGQHLANYPKVREYLLQLAETRGELCKAGRGGAEGLQQRGTGILGENTRAKTQHAMMKGALVKISRSPLDWPSSQGNSDPGRSCNIRTMVMA